MPSTVRALRTHRLPILILALALLVTPMLPQPRADAVSPGVEVVYVADGTNFADALVGSVLAALNNTVVLTVEGARAGDRIPTETAAELGRLQPKSIVVLGGPVAISDRVVTELGAFTEGEVTRLFGETRYATAVEISKALPQAIKKALFADNAGNAEKLDGYDSTHLSGIFGIRDTDYMNATTLTPDANGLAPVTELVFTAPTDGFVHISVSLLVRNLHDTDPANPGVLTFLDWDHVADADALDHVVAGGQTKLESEAGVVTESMVSFSSVVPVAAGEHHLEVMIGMAAGDELESNGEAVSVVFSPFGAAETAG